MSDLNEGLPPGSAAAPAGPRQGVDPSREVMILAHCFPPDNLVGALRPFRLYKYLPRFGFPCHVLTASPQPEPPPANVHYVGDRFQSSPAWPMRCFRFGLHAISRVVYPEGPGQALTWIPQACSRAERLLSRAPVRFLFSTFPPLATHLAALRLRQRHRGNLIWVADFRDPLSGNPEESPLGSFWSAQIEPWIFSRADWLIANTDVAAERWRARYPHRAHRISHIWNGFDPEEEIQAQPVPQRGYRLIAHVGTIYHRRPPQALLASLVRLQESRRLDPAAVRLSLVGGLEPQSIPDQRLLDSLIEKGTVQQNGEVPPEEAHRLMARADSLLLIDWTGDRSGLQVPYKLFTYLRVGRPILAITTRNSPVERILARSGVPYECLYPGDEAGETDAKVLRFLRLPAEPVRASAWFYDEFDGRRQAGLLAGVLEELLAERARRREGSA
ncbi:MAG: glycosyltransferase [Bryobacterales bacterium]|nr:glycosyltransferase [Bryobacterales bacterium]